jgi:hypothetical protein
VIEEEAEAMGCDLGGLGRIHLIEFMGLHRAPVKQLGIDHVARTDILNKSSQSSQVVHCSRR